MIMGQRTFAPILAAMLVLWPIIAYMGAQGYSGAIAIAGLLSIFFARRPETDRVLLAGLGFTLWIVLAGFWGPETDGFFIGNLGAGSFSLDMPGFRFALTALAGLGIFVAVQSVSPGSSIRSLNVVAGASLVQFGGMLITALFMAQILALLAPISHPVSEMPQNLMRNANAFLMLLPFLLAWIWHRDDDPQWTYASICLGVLSLVAFILTGTQTALFGVILMITAMAIVKRYPNTGFMILFRSLAAYVLASPILFAWLIPTLRDLGAPLPQSFFSRSYSWELVGQKIADSPLIGHGLEASQSWRDKYGDHPEWLADASARYGVEFAWEVYPVIPVHPHNMPLQIWAETGLIGAALAAAFLFFLGSKLKSPSAWSPISKYAAAGLIGACVAICSFAYSMWNEAFWASVILAAAVVFVQARHDGQPA